MTSEIQAWRHALILASAGAFAAMVALPLLLGFSVDYASFLPLYVLALSPAVALPWVIWRRLDAMRPALETVSLGLLLTIPVLVFTYSAMRLGLPLADPWLMRLDAGLGFDWPAFVRLVDRSATLSFLLALGYSSFAFQLLFLPVLLCCVRRPERAYALVLGWLVLCVLSAATGAAFPCVGAYVGHGIDPESLDQVSGKFGYFFLESFHAVRAGGPFSLGMDNAAGILTFPSVHAGVAALCAWAAWPSRALRLPFLLLNLLMTVSAITHGAHYLVDILAGIAVAAGTIFMLPVFVRLAARIGRAVPAPVPVAA